MTDPAATRADAASAPPLLASTPVVQSFHGSMMIAAPGLTSPTKRIGLATCTICGAAIFLHHDDDPDGLALHEAWHREQERPKVKPHA